MMKYICFLNNCKNITQLLIYDFIFENKFRYFIKKPLLKLNTFIKIDSNKKEYILNYINLNN